MFDFVNVLCTVLVVILEHPRGALRGEERKTYATERATLQTARTVSLH